ncbi:MAG: heparan-alpha-glucosaminide N-acetyltransferase domain-containing protein [Candidatus Helarchaeales archaeon]
MGSNETTIVEKIAPSGRIHSIDIVRGIAILIMIWVHFTMFFSFDFLFLTPCNFLVYGALTHPGPLSGPFFFTVSGLSLAIATTRRREKNIPERKIFLHVLKRGCIVILLGYAYSFIRAFWFLTPDRIFDIIFFWDLLHSLGLLMILTYFSLFLSTRMRVALLSGLIVAMMLMTYIPVLFGQPLFLPFHFLWQGGDYHYSANFVAWNYLMSGNIGMILVQFLIQITWCGTYPIIPWIFFNICGTIVAEITLKHGPSRNLNGMTENIMKTGAYMIIGGFIIFLSTNLLFSFSVFVDSAFYCLTCTGTFMVFYYCFYRMCDHGNAQIKPLEPIEFAGTLPLTIYILHGVVIGIILDGINLMIPIRHAFPSPLVLIPTTGLFILFVLMAFKWHGMGNKYSLDWLLSKIR